MIQIILQIKEAIENKGLSVNKAAKMANIEQTKVNRLLSGKVKKPDFEVIKKLQQALGLIADPCEGYAVQAVHRTITPEQEHLLKILEEMPDVRAGLDALIELPERKQKIHVGRMLEDLEKLQDEKK